MLREVVLHGALGEEFGGPFKFEVASPAEAVRALVILVRGVRDRLRQGHYRVIVGERDTGLELNAGDEPDAQARGWAELLNMRLGKLPAVHIVPVIAGAGGASGRYTGKIIAGVALIGIALTAGALAPAGAGFLGLGATLGGTSITAGMVAAVGLAVALSGVAGLLTSTGQQHDSFILSGQTNVTTQGGPVPIVIGEFVTGGVLISAGLQAYDLTVGSNTALAFDPSTSPNVSYYSTDG